MQLTPWLNLVFQQNEAVGAENEINYEEVMGSILADEIVQGAASLQMERYPFSHTTSLQDVRSRSEHNR